MSTVTTPETDIEMIEYANHGEGVNDEENGCWNCIWAWRGPYASVFDNNQVCRADWAMDLNYPAHLPNVPPDHKCAAWRDKEAKG